MKKTAKTILSFIGGVALVAAAAGAVYGLNSGVRKWVDDQIGRGGSTDSDAPDSTVTSASGALSATVSGGSVFGANGIRRAVSAGATKTVTFTVSPANATDKYVIVATSDASKVSISSTKVLSGTAVTLTLVAGEFNGAVNITAHPEALASSVVTIPVTVYNFLKSASVIGVHAVDETGVFEDNFFLDSGAASAQFADPFLYASLSGAAGSAQTFTANYLSGNFTGFVVEFAPRDLSILPSLIDDMTIAGLSAKASSALSSAGMGLYFVTGQAAASGTALLQNSIGTSYTLKTNCVYAFYDVAAATAAGMISKFLEDASFSLTTAAYVAPSGLAGDVGGVQFK